MFNNLRTVHLQVLDGIRIVAAHDLGTADKEGTHTDLSTRLTWEP